VLVNNFVFGLVVPGAFRALGSFRGHPGENSAVSASNFQPHPVGLRSSFIFLLMLPIVKMIGLGEQISSRGCCEATDVVGILCCSILPYESFGYLQKVS